MRPVFSSGRCLPTCGQSEFFDLSSSSCKNCDPSCSSCSGSGSTNCLACSSPDQVLLAGSCVSANCTDSTSVVPNLGVCLSELVQVLNSTNTYRTTTSSTSTSMSTTSSSASTTGPIVLINGHQVPWWQILLMVLGGVVALILILLLWRRFARRKRVEETVMFASARQIDGTDGLRWRLKQVKDILFGRKKAEYFDEPPMTSFDDGVSHRHRELLGRNLDIELRSPEAYYLDDALSSYPSPMSMHRRSTRSKPFQPTKSSLGSRSSAKRRSIEYLSEVYSPMRRQPSKNHFPTRGYLSDDDRSPTSGYYRSDDPSLTKRYPSRRYRSRNHPLTRGYLSDDHSSTRRYPSFARSPTTSDHPPHWDRLDNSLSRYPRKISLSSVAPPPSYPSQSEHGRASLSRKVIE